MSLRSHRCRHSRDGWRQNCLFKAIHSSGRVWHTVLMIALLARPFVFYPPFAERIGEYLFFCVFFCLFFLFGQRFLSNPRADSRQILQAGVAWVGTCLLPFWGLATPAGGKKRRNEIRVVSFLNRTATISVYLSVTKCGRICRAHTCTHSAVEP